MGCFVNKREQFPRGVPYILWNIFFDRFSSGGFIVILAIYLNQKLLFDTNTATAIYHINEFFLYFFSIVGALIGDYIGIYKTLTVMSLLCACSATIISVASLEVSLMPLRIFSFIGLTGAMIGMGCVKSNQNVFGGNQFKLPEQSKMLDYYFSMHYFILKCGQVGGMILMPVLREDVKCFGSDSCYPLAFSVITLLMTLAVIILWLGRKVFIHVPPTSENIIIEVIKCIKHALKIKFLTISETTNNKKSHWLDNSEDKFGPKLVQETKVLLNVLVMYLPLPIFWALLNQQSSRWVFQATRMNGDIGFYKIKPDQMIVLGPIAITILIPLFNQFVFPQLEKLGIKSPLQKMASGMIVAGLSFIVSAYIETQINQHYISILWLFPQYLLVSISEILLWVANISFAYTQAPKSMKSVMTSSVYMSVAGGSLIVFFISGFRIFTSLVYEFLFYACLMFLDTVIFCVLAMRFKYTDNEIVAMSAVSNNNNNNCDKSDNESA
ncbi:hypothetical protein PVAND_012680 [Polypedilum vanderplanki]|uniref:Uncharacterized protein n=1 Tax=Polypedilum vanderplanki TaxID=319348 RepID=A0A9J6CP29_POLVA|nr:hypothetical protein PVAND_012680 [Polypedilum vanderplanki]